MYSYNPDRRGLSEVKLLKLEPWRLYPKGNDLCVDFLKNQSSNLPCVTQKTPIASIGSCFAREIKIWLKENNYNFIETATGPCTEAGSARYDRVYNTYTMRQEFERAFGHFAPQEKYWEFKEQDQIRLLDPYRKGVAWEDHDEMNRELAEHQQNVQKAFSKAEILIMTIGQAEIWYHKSDNYVYPLVPPVQIFDENKHSFRMTSFQENLENLERVFELFNANNFHGHIVISLSPVPLRATFRDLNAVTANTASKAMLRAVIDAFAEAHSDRVTYFPAYEVVSVLQGEPFEDDNRHVKPEAVDEIMQLFESWFVTKQSVTALG